MKRIFKNLIILGIILVFLVVGMIIFLKSLDNERSKNHDIRREEDIKTISSALQNYVDKHNGVYPTDLLELKKFFPELYLPTYFGEIDYKYRRIDDNRYCLYTELESRKDVLFAIEKGINSGKANCILN